MVCLAVLLVAMGVRPAFADPPGGGATAPAPAPSGNLDPPGSDLAGQGAEAATPTPNLQLQDEGPLDTPSGVRLTSRARARQNLDDGDEKPFWKNWVFWTVTGVLIAGAAGLIVYRAAGTNSSIAPCPPSVVVSLGCFGAGRNQ